MESMFGSCHSLLELEEPHEHIQGSGLRQVNPAQSCILKDPKGPEAKGLVISPWWYWEVIAWFGGEAYKEEVR